MFVTPSCAVDKRRVQSIWRPERWCDTETVARPAPAPAVEPPTPPPPQKARSKWTLPVGLALVVFAPLAGVGGGDLGTVALLAMVGSGMALPGGIILPLWRTASAVRRVPPRWLRSGAARGIRCRLSSPAACARDRIIDSKTISVLSCAPCYLGQSFSVTSSPRRHRIR